MDYILHYCQKCLMFTDIFSHCITPRRAYIIPVDIMGIKYYIGTYII